MIPGNGPLTATPCSASTFQSTGLTLESRPAENPTPQWDATGTIDETGRLRSSDRMNTPLQVPEKTDDHRPRPPNPWMRWRWRATAGGVQLATVGLTFSTATKSMSLRPGR